jgi:hypothetical protein
MVCQLEFSALILDNCGQNTGSDFELEFNIWDLGLESYAQT